MGFRAVEPGDRQRLMLLAAGRRFSLAADDVSDVSVATAAVPIPHGGDICEGVVDRSGEATIRVRLGKDDGGRFAVVVRTPRGPVQIRADAVAFAEDGGCDGLDDALPFIERRLSGFADSQLSNGGAPMAERRIEKATELLIADVAGRTIATPACDVLRIARPTAFWKTDRPGHIVIETGDGVLPGFFRGGVADAPWVVAVRIDGKVAAVLADAIHGIVAAPRDCIQRIDHAGIVSIWFKDTARGAIEIVAPGVLAGTPDASSPMVLVAESDDASESRPARMTRGVEATVGPFSCVFDGDCVGAVVRGLVPDDVQVRRVRGACPAFDLATLLGLSRPAAFPKRAIVTSRFARRSVVLLADDLAPAETDAIWKPLPVVPSVVRSLFKAMAIEGGRGRFLVEEAALIRPPPSVAALVSEAFAGWLTPAALDGNGG